MTSDHYEALRLLGGALTVACQELEELETIEFPMPDEIEKKLQEHAWMKEALGQLEGDAKEQAKRLYREAKERHPHAHPQTPDLGTTPIKKETKAALDQAVEDVRRLMRLNRDLYDVLLEGGWGL